MQQMGENEMAFSHKIVSASPGDIQRHARDYQASVPFRIEHDGIDDGFDGKASVVRYCRLGEWHTLQGAD